MSVLFVVIIPITFLVLVLSHSRSKYKFLLKAEQERYAEIMQRTLLIQQQRDSNAQELEYIKALFNMNLSRPINAYMTDTQVSQLAMAITTMVQGNITGMN